MRHGSGWTPNERRPMLSGMASARTKTLDEALYHLERLVLLSKEWQTDWAALRPLLPNGKENPDFDPAYMQLLTQSPEHVFHTQVLEAEAFLRRVRS